MCWMCTQEFPDATVPADIHADPHQVGTAARELSATGQALRDAARRLRTLANDDLTVSLAIDEVRERARDTVTTVDKVAGRYEDAGSALATYRTKLDDALGRLRAARDTVDTNNDNSRYVRHRRWELERELRQGTIDSDGSTELITVTRRSNEYENSSVSAQARATTAREDIRTAALVAAAALDDAAETAGLNDGFWDAVGGVFQVVYEWAQENLGPILEIIRDVLKVLKSILDIICLIVTILSIFIPILAPLAAALTAVSLILGGLILLCSLVLFALGRLSAGELLGDAIDFAAGIITSKLGGIKPSSLAGFTSAGRAAWAAGQEGAQYIALPVGQRALQVAGEMSRDALVNTNLNVLGNPFVQGWDATVDFAPRDGGPAWGDPPAPPAFDTSDYDPTPIFTRTADLMTGGLVTPGFELVNNIQSLGDHTWNATASAA